MKIVCLDALTLGDVDLSEFAKFGEFVSFDMTKSSQTISRLSGADVVITNKVLITKEVMDATNLKLICVSATGTNNIDMAYAKERGIPVKNVAGYSTPSVVQQTFASILTLLNNVRYYDDYVKNGEWVRSEIFTNLDAPIFELSGKNFGIIGLGEIGKGVAKVASAFGANVCYFSPSGNTQDVPYQRVELDEMLQACDIVSIHAPLNEKTKGLIGKRELGLMKKGAIISNFGRGGIIDESALAVAIDERGIKAVLDVLECEPMSENNALLSVKNKQNLLITPHVAWASFEARIRLVNLMVKNIEDFINGK
ncbi:D-2-hydroxyacid dehydrogenase [Campylobacter mucosalis]|uniref:2-hydroxyacid dehydrogenase n=1 Tax=Campylobacter mucosalis CCUG 21559 TaxID=1032067 RepID=A0A6G5QE51_9BACT|nr:D-2-hydroxyacid dehydrogenase [Campylobacter mucosalis]QCD43965.1 2-hydroxyacid dehydrogenase [Campylobacter mucosalis CCUG 21559]